MKKRLWLLLLLVIPLFTSSCSKEDGDWDQVVCKHSFHTFAVWKLSLYHYIILYNEEVER